VSNRVRIYLNLAVFVVIFALFAGWAVRNVVSFDAIDDPYSLVVYADGASGVSHNAEVAYLGVHYGQVTSVRLVDGGVRINMKIDHGKRIPIGSVPRIFRKSPIGEPYIDFNPPPDLDPDTARYYHDGDEVVDAQGKPLRATVPLEFSELLRTASDLISNIDPQQAASLLSELATALEGRGADLHRLTTATDQLASTFAARTDVLNRLAENSTRLTEVLADHRGALGSTITDLSALASSLRNASGNTQILLDRGTRLLTLAADLVEDGTPAINCLLGDLVPVMHALGTPDRLANVADVLQTGPEGFGDLYSTIDNEPDGPWVRVNLDINLSSPPQQFVPPKELPAIQPMVDCPGVVPRGAVRAADGTVVGSSAGDFDPTDVLTPPSSSPALPTTGAAAAGTIAAVLVLAAWAMRRISAKAT
jgi:phospholipid/cholesterol/gamma-HCH transport system substrate-binding protein